MRHLLTVLALLTIPGCASSTVPGAGGRSEGDFLSLRLEADSPVIRDLQQTRLKVTVKNTGDEIIILDNELVAGFDLKIETDLSDGSLFSQDRDVLVESVRTLNKPSPKERAKRFVRLAPGETLSCHYDLSRPIRGGVLSALNGRFRLFIAVRRDFGAKAPTPNAHLG